MTDGLISLLVGLADPASASAPSSANRSHNIWDGQPLQERSQLTTPGINWTGLGTAPRWTGTESSDCAAALEPGIYHGRGADERDRYLAGAASRSETALLISTIGDVSSTYKHPLAVNDASVSFSLESGSVGGRRLPDGVNVTVAEGLSRADRDLALRLKNRPPGAWWALSLSGSRVTRGDGMPMGVQGPDGTLTPLLTDPLGAPVAAVWTALTSNVRWYIVPDQSDWPTLVSWLVEQALPAYVPGALIRARSAAHVDEAFLTAGEAAARSALANLEEQYTRDKETLTQRLAEATAAATQVRDGLLYGSGGELVQAVQTVLEAAGFGVHDLDTELGGTVSADLLAVLGDSRCLVEVKSVTGDAGERLAGDLQRHLSTWSALQPPQQPVTCGALVVNHQTRRAPGERDSQAYTRAEFVSSLQFPVLPALQLLTWWLASDWPAIKSALLQAEPHAPGTSTPVPDQPQAAASAKPMQRRLLRWRPGGKG